MSRKLASLPLKRGLNADVVKHGRAQSHGEIANRTHCIGVESLRVFYSSTECFKVSISQRFEMSKFHTQGRHHLTDLVMELARQSLAFQFLGLYEPTGKPAEIVLCLFNLFGLFVMLTFEQRYAARGEHS